MNIEEIIEHAVRKVVREELERHDKSIATSFPEKESKYGDINWLCKFLGVEKQTVYGYNTAKKYPFIKKGKKLMYDKAEIMELVTKTRSKTVKEIKEEALQGLARLKKVG